MKRLFGFGMIVAVSALVGCGGNKAGCNITNENRCQEKSTTLPGVKESFKTLCGTIPNAVWEENGCPAENRIGECDLSSLDAADTVDIYYSPRTVDDARMSCDGTFKAL